MAPIPPPDATTLPDSAEVLAIPSAGTVAGSVAGGIRRFLGIPYAAPPVGRNRFAPPQPVEPWTGIRDATVPGPCAPQRIKDFRPLDILPLIGDAGARGDDYLTLNIWTPQGAAKRPVMLFIHGGGFMAGSKDAPVQDGTGFARSGVVLVAINYRLAVDGFLPIPGIPTNLGLRDMIAALAWVRDHIALFGGDPDNITVFGESAGGVAIAALIASPLATDLFRRAIIQSGHGSIVRDIGVARRLVTTLARMLKVTPDAPGFAAPDTDRLYDAIGKVSRPTARLDLRDPSGREPAFGITRFLPVYGDDVLPEHPLAALARGVGSDIDVLIGTNAEEMNLYWVPTGIKKRMFGLLARYILHRAHPDATKLLRAYGLGETGRATGDIFARATTDLVFRWPARLYAAAHRGRTHMYEFDWRSPACNGALGAAHALELPFVFDTLHTVAGERGIAGIDPPQALATRIHQLWVGFATDGSLPWPEFDEQGRQIFQLAANRPIHEPALPVAPYLP